MTDLRKREPFLVVGNWKMNGSRRALDTFQSEMKSVETHGVTIALCLPAALISAGVKAFEGSDMGIGGQNCHSEQAGAFTGEISAEMLADVGADYVIVGHSERREFFSESDLDVARKGAAAHKAGLTTVLCVGETHSQRAAGNHVETVLSQLKASLPKSATRENTVVAYEPVWAIGSGESASLAQIEEMHSAISEFLRDRSCSLVLLYGGSVKPDTAKAIAGVNAVDGFLVGGASLKAADFGKIIRSVQ